MTLESNPAAAPPAAQRRQLTFHSLDEVLAEAARLVAAPDTKMLGQWPLERLLGHLAAMINDSIDGVSIQAPLVLRLVGPLFRPFVVRSRMPAGFKLPSAAEATAYPPVASPEAGLEMLRAAVGHLQTERMTSRHPVLGRLTHDQWYRIHLRHAELHLGFAVP